jgi:adenylate cyclase
MGEFWRRLQQRKLAQWAVAYAAAAFALVQGVDIFAQRFGWPDAIERGLLIACVVGFFTVLVVAWYHGERGAQRVSNMEISILTVLLLIGGGALWWYAPGPRSPAPMATGSPAATPANDADRRSIAVLPFVNMSGDKDNEYFSDGISEEILNVLAKTPDLHVAARTSSFAFKDKAMEVPAIARELNVRMVLEGSVRKQGDRVRITAQLIDAKTGFHVFSQTYDRELKDIFAIQDEIAKAIGSELEVKLAGAPVPGKNSVGTTNLKAYDLYLRGIALWQTRSEENLWQAVDVFKQAVAADPAFAQAYGGLALVYAVIPDYSARISYPEAGEKLTDAAEMALALDPTLPEPYAALSTPAGWERRRSATAALLRRAIALRPSFATAYQWLGTELMAAGDPAAGLAALDHAAELDPRSLVVMENRAFVLMALGRISDARASCDRVLAFAPDYASCLNRSGLAEILRGDPEAARPFLVRLAELRDPAALPLVNAAVDALQGRGDRQALAKKLAGFEMRSSVDPDSGNVFTPADTTTLLVLFGAPDLAMAYLEKSFEVPGNDPTDWTMMLPVLDPIRCTPRFKALLERLNTHDPRAATVCASAGT